jgi:SAM-dependent methyltransferase
MVVEWSSRHCLLCGRQFEGRTFLCRECSDYYRDRPVPPDVYRRFYEALDREHPQRSNTYGSYNEPVGLMRAIERLPRNARILELGAGGGHLGIKLRELGFKHITLSDVTETALEAMRGLPDSIDVVYADALNLPFQSGSFEVIISTDVIEHLPDVLQHMSEVRRVLVSDGIYMVKTPNRFVAEAYYRLRGMHDAYFWHPSMLSPGELRATLAAFGFDVSILPVNHLTDAQLAKLPGPTALRSIARRLPTGVLPVNLQPHLEAVAKKRA